MFDLFFFHFLNSHDSLIVDKNFSDESKASREVQDVATELFILEIVRRNKIDHALLIKAFGAIPFRTIEVEKEVENENITAVLSSAATAIVNLRSLLGEIPHPNPSQSTSESTVNQSTDPKPFSGLNLNSRDALQYSFMETVSLIYLLKSCQQGLSLPLSWVHAVAFKSCLELIIAGNICNHVLFFITASISIFHMYFKGLPKILTYPLLLYSAPLHFHFLSRSLVIINMSH